MCSHCFWQSIRSLGLIKLPSFEEVKKMTTSSRSLSLMGTMVWQPKQKMTVGSPRDRGSGKPEWEERALLSLQMLLQGSVTRRQPAEVSLGLWDIHSLTGLRLPPAELSAFTEPNCPALCV